ncbi:MAG: hypothetical protein MN733_03360 [Nitrososphaera sp.]|nr:hypothetical protein [Nitrososphaera sp.]
MRMINLIAGSFLGPIASVILVSFTSPVLAVDFSQVIKDQYDKPIVRQGETSPLTLGQVASIALFNVDDKTTPEDRYRRGILGTKIAISKADMPLTAEEISIIKDAIGRAFGPLIVARSWGMLDPGVKGSQSSPPSPPSAPSTPSE